MDVVELQNQIIARPEYIADLFEEMGFKNIRDKGEYYSFQNIQGDNPNAIAIYKDSLHYENFSHGSRGNLFTLVMETNKCSFPQAIDYVAQKLGLQKVAKIVLPFNGFYKKITKNGENEVACMPHYSEKELPSADSLSYKFLQDGVSLQVQRKLGVRYSHSDDAVLIPIYDINHSLVGCKARNNASDVDMAHRWFMYIPYAKSNIVYGLDVNYTNIIKKEAAIIFEAEKSVMQSMSFNLNIGLGIGGHCLSPTQAKYIKMLNTKELIVAFDQDLSEEEVRYEATKLKIRNDRFSNRVFYLYDRKGEYLPRGSKMSPSDPGRQCLKQLLQNCKYEVK